MNARRLVVLALALAGMAVTARLGWWQLSRADEKLAWQAAIAQREQLPALDARELQAGLARPDAEALLHRNVVLRGQWLADRTLFLDNRVMERRSGFYVLTPLRLVGDGRVVLVLRGWAPRNAADRTVLPAVATPAGEVELHGRVIQRPPPTFALGRESSGPIRQNLDLQGYARETGLPLAAVMVQQLGPASEGLERHWPPPASGVETNYGYAVQWFGLSILIAVLVAWFQVVRPYRSSRRVHATQ